MTPPKITAVHHIALEAVSPAAALAPLAHFMDQALRPVRPAERERWLAAPNVFLCARPVATAAGRYNIPTPGLGHLCLRTRDREQGRALLQAGGVRLIADPLWLGTGFYYSYSRDPDGRLIEMENADFTPTRAQGWVAHVSWVARDLTALSTFYGQLLGRPTEESARLGDNPLLDRVGNLPGVSLQFAWVTGLNINLEFIRYFAPAPQGEPGDTSGYAHVAFETDDPMAAARAAIGLGAQPAAAVPVWGEDWPAVRDPEGNLLVFVTPPSEAWRVAALPGATLEAEMAQARAEYLAAQ